MTRPWSYCLPMSSMSDVDYNLADPMADVPLSFQQRVCDTTPAGASAAVFWSSAAQEAAVWASEFRELAREITTANNHARHVALWESRAAICRRRAELAVSERNPHCKSVAAPPPSVDCGTQEQSDSGTLSLQGAATHTQQGEMSSEQQRTRDVGVQTDAAVYERCCGTQQQAGHNGTLDMQQGASNAKVRSQRLCVHFRDTGMCRKGAKCTRIHMTPTAECSEKQCSATNKCSRYAICPFKHTEKPK